MPQQCSRLVAMPLCHGRQQADAAPAQRHAQPRWQKLQGRSAPLVVLGNINHMHIAGKVAGIIVLVGRGMSVWEWSQFNA